jgi:predicted TIM-barrel fold metal-dependent hydrolase
MTSTVAPTTPGPPATATRPYTVISADCHAGGSHAQYRDYLDPQYRDEFDAWRAKYRNPYRDLNDSDRRIRNWDSDRRWREQESQGVVAEVLFPNTIPPFFPSFVLFAPPPKPEDYERRRAGIHAHNRWMADFVSECPERRAGIGQIFLNDVDHALEDARWIKENGLRGGILLPNVPPDVKWIEPLNHPRYDPLWEVCQDLEIPVNSHGGTGFPEYARVPSSALLMLAEITFYSQRPFLHLILGGVFERFPRLQFIMTEMGCGWMPSLLQRLDAMLEGIRKRGAIGELRFGPDMMLPRSATDYFRQNCWMGVSSPTPADAAARHQIGVDRFMWGNDYPHDEGTYPYTIEHLRQLFCDTPEEEMRALLGENAARLYGFDLGALAPPADRCGPTVEELHQPLERLPEEPNEVLIRGSVPADAGVVY